MSDSKSKADSTSTARSKPEIQRYSVAKGKYSSQLQTDRPSSTASNSHERNSKNGTARSNPKNTRYPNDGYGNGNYSSYYPEANADEDEYYYNYQPRPPRKNPRTKPTVEPAKANKAASTVKDSVPSEGEPVRTHCPSQDLDKRIESMTFENQTLSESKPSDAHAGLIFLPTKESHAETNDTESSQRQFYNQTRAKQQTRKPSVPSQPRPITQSSRGLTNVTRTLYDPNAPPPKTPPMPTVQTISTPKILPSPQPTPPLANSQAQIQEFHQQ